MLGLPQIGVSDFDWLIDETVWFDNQKLHPIEFELLNVDDAQPEELSFSWELITFTETELII